MHIIAVIQFANDAMTLGCMALLNVFCFVVSWETKRQ